MTSEQPARLTNLCTSRDLLELSCTLVATEITSQSIRLPRRQHSSVPFIVGEAGSHRGGAQAGRVEPDSAYTTAHHTRTGGGRSATPLSIQLCLWVGSLCRWVTARRLPGRHSSVGASPLRCRTGLLGGVQYLGKTASKCR